MNGVAVVEKSAKEVKEETTLRTIYVNYIEVQLLNSAFRRAVIRF